MPAEIRVGIVGAGFVAQLHARALTRIGQAIAAVAGRDRDRTAAFAAEHHVGLVVDEWQTLVTTPDLDLVVVAAPTAHHAEITVSALEAGRHVVCEKPLASSLAEAQAMVDTAERTGRFLGYAEQETFAPNYHRLLELIVSGAIGDPVLVKHRGAHSGPHSPWFYAPEAGGGAIIDMGVHGVHLARAAFGGAMPVEVVARGRTLRHDTSLEDDALLLVDFGKQRLAEIEASWIQLGGLDDHLEVYGLHGHALARISPNEGLQVYAEHGIADAAEKAVPTPGWASVSGDELHALGYVGQAADYMAAIARDASPSVTGRDGLIVMQVVDAAYRSISAGTPISIGKPA